MSKFFNWVNFLPSPGIFIGSYNISVDSYWIKYVPQNYLLSNLFIIIWSFCTAAFLLFWFEYCKFCILITHLGTGKSIRRVQKTLLSQFSEMMGFSPIMKNFLWPNLGLGINGLSSIFSRLCLIIKWWSSSLFISLISYNHQRFLLVLTCPSIHIK